MLPRATGTAETLKSLLLQSRSFLARLCGLKNRCRAPGAAEIVSMPADVLKRQRPGGGVVIDGSKPDEIAAGGMQPVVIIEAPAAFETTAGFVAAVRASADPRGGGAETPLVSF